MRRLLEWVTRHPKLVVAVSALITLFFALQVPNLKIETDGKSLIPADHPAIIYSDKVQALFGLGEVIAIGIACEKNNEGVFNEHSLALLQRLTENIKRIEGVNPHNVISIATEEYISTKGGVLRIAPFLEKIPQTQEDIRRLKEDVLSVGLYQGTLVSSDGVMAAIVVELQQGIDRKKVYFDIKQRIAAEGEIPERIVVVGSPVAEAMLGTYTVNDLQVMLPIVSVVISVVLFLTYRRWQVVLLSLIEVLSCVIWTLGLMSLFHVPIYIVTVIMPVILIAVGVADEIHIFARYYDEARDHPEKEKRQRIIDSMSDVAQPIIFTALTTAAGFLSFVFTSMKPLQYFGAFTAFGILGSMVLSLSFVPAMLMMMKEQHVNARKVSSSDSFAASSSARHWGTRIGNFIFEHKLTILVAAVLFLLLSLFGVSKVYVQDSWIGNFKPSSDVAAADALFNQHFYGTNRLDVIVVGQQAEVMYEPALLQKIEAFQQFLRSLPSVGGSLSIADYVKAINATLHEGKEEFRVLPTSRETVSQELLLYSTTVRANRLHQFVDNAYQRTRIQVFLNQANYVKTAAVISAIESSTRYHFADVGVHLAGDVQVSQTMVGQIVSDQIASLFTAMLGDFLLIVLMFRSLMAGLLAVIPVMFAVLLNFDVMGLLGIPLGVATSMFSSLAFGIGIDYNIHFLARYRKGVLEGNTARDATMATMATSGRAIVFNALAIIAGFLVLLFSAMPPNQLLGALISLCMGSCFIAAMTVLPMAINLIKPRFIFSSLRNKQQLH
jgi:predicted RND superfamily exporter protein